MKNFGTLFGKFITEDRKAIRCWRTLAGILAVVVTFTTTYSLILPAITVSREEVEEVAGLYLEEPDYMVVGDEDDDKGKQNSGSITTSVKEAGAEPGWTGELFEEESDDETEAEGTGLGFEEETEETEVETGIGTEAATEAMTGSASEAVTEASTEAVAEATTEKVTEEETKIETEEETEAVTEAATEIETESEAETESEIETEEENEAETEIGEKTEAETEYRVTYPSLKRAVITASGETYEITVTYDESAGIPEGAELVVQELLPDTEEYQEHLQAIIEKLGL